MVCQARPGVKRGGRTEIQLENIHTVCVVGPGVMGAGIAQVFAQAGYNVRLHARHGPQRLADFALGDPSHLNPELSDACEPLQVAQDLVNDGCLEGSTRRGFHAYQEGEPEQIIAERDAKLLKLLQTLGLAAGTPQPGT
jgi:hypothetical protein